MKPLLLMQEFNCSKAIIYDIKRNKERILQYILTTKRSGGAKKRKTLKKESYEDVEKAKYLWLLQERSRGTPLLDLFLPSRHYIPFICFVLMCL